MKHILVLALILTSFIATTFSKEKETLVLYSYHYHVPFLIDLEKRKGLTFELIDFLNSLDTKYDFEVVFSPRSRLEKKGKEIEKPILWTSPTWFKDKKKTKYHWSSVLMNDKDVFVSKMKFDYKNLDSLLGLSIVLPKGFYFYGVTEMAKEKKIKPVYVHSERQSLKMIIQGRADIAIIGHSMLTNLLDNDLKESRDILRISTKAHDEFERRILFPKRYHKQFVEINRVLKSENVKKEWNLIIKRYNLALEKRPY